MNVEHQRQLTSRLVVRRVRQNAVLLPIFWSGIRAVPADDLALPKGRRSGALESAIEMGELARPRSAATREINFARLARRACYESYLVARPDIGVEPES